MKSPFSKLSVVKLPKHRRFDFTPRHYDEAKERLENRKKVIAQELGLSDEGEERVKREIDFRAKLQNNRVSNYNANASRMSSIRLFLILGILLLVFYIVYGNLDDIIASLTK